MLYASYRPMLGNPTEDSLRSRIPIFGFRIPGARFGILYQLNLDSEFLKLNSGFQRPELLIFQDFTSRRSRIWGNCLDFMLIQSTHLLLFIALRLDLTSLNIGLLEGSSPQHWYISCRYLWSYPSLSFGMSGLNGGASRFRTLTTTSKEQNLVILK